MQGKVKWFNEQKGFGFIERNGEPGVFVHYSQISSEGFKTLIEGQRVTFELGNNSRGLQAIEVKVIS